MLNGKYTLFIDQCGNRYEARTVSELRAKVGGGRGKAETCRTVETILIGEDTK